MITHASFKNFKSLRSAEIDFERLTVIVGPNASGKTSILEGLDCVSDACSEARSASRNVSSGRPWARLRTQGATGEMELMCLTADTVIRLSNGTLSGVDRAQFRKHGQTAWAQFTNLSANAQQAIKATMMLRLDETRLAAPSYSNRPVPTLDRDGGNLASVLAFLTVNQPDTFQKLQEHLRAVIPSVRRIRGDRQPIRRFETKIVPVGTQNVEVQEQKEYVGDALILDFDGASGIPSDLASSGTLFVIGLLTAILGPGKPALLLLDDIERGLHPKAQRGLIGLLHKLLKEQPDLQIIATSHSPYLLDELDQKEVRITYAVDGNSYCAPLTAHPDFERWKEEMSPGEFWSAVGESWAKDVPAAGAT